MIRRRRLSAAQSLRDTLAEMCEWARNPSAQKLRGILHRIVADPKFWRRLQEFQDQTNKARALREQIRSGRR